MDRDLKQWREPRGALTPGWGLAATALAMLALAMLSVVIPARADVLGELPDPTRPHVKPARTTLAVRGGNATGVTLTLQSTLVSQDRRIAVINGKLLHVGERVGDADVVEIQPHQVIVSRSGVRQVLKLLPETNGLRKMGLGRRDNNG